MIVTCVPCCLRYPLSLRDLEELMAERGLSVDYTCICHSRNPQVLDKRWSISAGRRRLWPLTLGA